MSEQSDIERQVSKFLEQVEDGHPPWYMLNSSVSKTCYKAFQYGKPWQELGTDPLNLLPLSFGDGNAGTNLSYADENQERRDVNQVGERRLIDGNGAEFEYTLSEDEDCTQMAVDKCLRPGEGVDGRYAPHRQTYYHRLDRGVIWEQMLREEQNNSAGWAINRHRNTTFCMGSVNVDEADSELSRLRGAGVKQNRNSLVFIIGRNYDWVFRHCSLDTGLWATAVRSHSGELIYEDVRQLNQHWDPAGPDSKQSVFTRPRRFNLEAIHAECSRFSAAIESEQAASKSNFFVDAGEGPPNRPCTQTENPEIPHFLLDWGMPEGVRRTYTSTFLFDLYDRSDSKNIFLTPPAEMSEGSENYSGEEQD